jgi:hypothetical protein
LIWSSIVVGLLHILPVVIIQEKSHTFTRQVVTGGIPQLIKELREKFPEFYCGYSEK